MRDVIVIVVVLGFFALAVGYVGWCERIIAGGVSEPHRTEPHRTEPPDRAGPESQDAADAVASGARR